MAPRSAKATTGPSALIGRYFLGAPPHASSPTDRWMGQVRSAEAEGFFYLDLFDWFIGAYSNSTLVHIRDMVGWTFLNDRDDLGRAADLHMRRLDTQLARDGNAAEAGSKGEGEE